jgi:hypothetical protein
MASYHVQLVLRVRARQSSTHTPPPTPDGAMDEPAIPLRRCPTQMHYLQRRGKSGTRALEKRRRRGTAKKETKDGKRSWLAGYVQATVLEVGGGVSTDLHSGCHLLESLFGTHTALWLLYTASVASLISCHSFPQRRPRRKTGRVSCPLCQRLSNLPRGGVRRITSMESSHRYGCIRYVRFSILFSIYWY